MFRRSNLVFPMLILGASLLLGCGKTSKTETASEPEKGTVETMPPSQNPTPQSASGTTAPATTPEHVTVQHILIGFVGSVQGKPITRSKEEAKTLAYQILDRARRGEDFDALVKQYTDDSPPGIYAMSGSGIAPGPDESSRGKMVPAFGNVGFAISPGDIGIADYDPTTSPYGWHIIKRLK
jgi:parvulin-like peptidyl-prolyl cis-trans isomerase-like protein